MPYNFGFVNSRPLEKVLAPRPALGYNKHIIIFF